MLWKGDVLHHSLFPLTFLFFPAGKTSGFILPATMATPGRGVCVAISTKQLHLPACAPPGIAPSWLGQFGVAFVPRCPSAHMQAGGSPDHKKGPFRAQDPPSTSHSQLSGAALIHTPKKIFYKLDPMSAVTSPDLPDLDFSKYKRLCFRGRDGRNHRQQV